MEETRVQRKNRGKLKKGLIVTVLIMAITLTSGYVSAQVYINQKVDIDTFYSGISVDGISLEGLTKQQALEKLSQVHQEQLQEFHIQLKYNGKTWEFGPQDIDARTNLNEIVEMAYETGRQGNWLERTKTIWKLQTTPINFSTEIAYSADLLKDKVEQIAQEINQEPVDATIHFYPDKEEKFTITAEKKGYKIDADKILQSIEEGLNQSPEVELELQPEEVQPQVFASQLEKQTHRIAVFSTLVHGSQSRFHNVFLAAQQFNGKVIQPGEVVSFNQTTGQRTKANGYQAAPVIKADKSLEDDLGGGVCQTSSTLYNAILGAGLEIDQRTHHSFPSTYVPKGLDATVNWPNLDLKFKNNKETPVYLRTYRKGNDLYVEVYGDPLENNQEVRLSSEVVKTYKAPEPKIVADTKHQYVTYEDETFEKVPSRPGYKVKSYRAIYQDGKEISKELLAEDFYKPITGIIYKGTEPRPQEAPSEIEQPQE